MPLLVKRYPNRKLYDTQEKKYISIECIKNYIRQGDDIKVVDNVTGEDLTAVILSQILLENEKKRDGSLPVTVLKSLINSGEFALNVLHRNLTSKVEYLSHFEDEIKLRFAILVEAGEIPFILAEELTHMLVSVEERNRVLFGSLEEALGNILNMRGIASRDVLSDLSVQIEQLSIQVDELERKRSKRDNPD